MHQPIYTKSMNLLIIISNAFINTMGITQPSPQQAKRAAWFIVVLLTAVVAAICSIAFLALRWASHH
jgi:ABC-type amino acid transport system permease subunit